jgi:hypothetical protein
MNLAIMQLLVHAVAWVVVVVEQQKKNWRSKCKEEHTKIIFGKTRKR